MVCASIFICFCNTLTFAMWILSLWCIFSWMNWITPQYSYEYSVLPNQHPSDTHMCTDARMHAHMHVYTCTCLGILTCNERPLKMPPKSSLSKEVVSRWRYIKLPVYQIEQLLQEGGLPSQVVLSSRGPSFKSRWQYQMRWNCLEISWGRCPREISWKSSECDFVNSTL